MQVNMRIDDNLKNSAEPILDSMGLSMTTAFTMFLKAVVRTNSIPFAVVGDPFYSSENMKHLDKLIKGIESGEEKLTEHSLIEVD